MGDDLAWDGPDARRPQTTSSLLKSVSIAVTAALLGAANLIIWFPGEAGPDSQSQYAQAVAGHFDDWHPPIMAWLWSMFRLIADGDGPMFCFQVACYWLGFGLIALALARAGRSLAGWAIIGVALFPAFVTHNIVLVKDVGMAVTFLAAFAAFFWYRMQHRDVPPRIIALSAVLLLYGTLVRANAVFAVVPLFVYMLRPRWLARPWLLLAASLPVALAIIPAAGLFNRHVLHAEPLRLIRSLQIFDITGIAFYSGDLTVFGTGNSFSLAQVSNCYAPVGWDRLAPWGECRAFWNHLAVSSLLQEAVEKADPKSAMAAEPNPALPHLWIAAIVHHPVAYATHRLSHFGSEITRGASMGAPDASAPKPRSIVLYDWVTASALWLAIGAGMLVSLSLQGRVQRNASIDAALALLLSGLSYACAYLVVGVRERVSLLPLEPDCDIIRNGYLDAEAQDWVRALRRDQIS